MRKASGNVLDALCGRFQRIRRDRLGLREAFGDRFVAARKLAKLLHAQLKLARSLVMFVGDEKRGHQKKPLIAHLADRAPFELSSRRWR